MTIEIKLRDTPLIKPISPDLRLGRFSQARILEERRIFKSEADEVEYVRARIAKIAKQNPKAFRKIASIKMGQTKIQAGSLLRLCRDIGIPLVITQNNRTITVMAYLSESQASWRRFGGIYLGKYYKGRNEHFQTFEYHFPFLLIKCKKSSL